MEDENTFWLAIWRTVGITLVAVAAIIAGCAANQNRLVANMVEAGADPIKASCAVHSIGANNAAVCTATVLKP